MWNFSEITNLSICDKDGNHISDLGNVTSAEVVLCDTKEYEGQLFSTSLETTLEATINIDKVLKMHLMSGVSRNVIHKMLYAKKFRIRKKYTKKYLGEDNIRWLFGR